MFSTGTVTRVNDIEIRFAELMLSYEIPMTVENRMAKGGRVTGREPENCSQFMKSRHDHLQPSSSKIRE